MDCPNSYCNGILEFHRTSFYDTSYCSSCGFYDKKTHTIPIIIPNIVTGYEKRHKKLKNKKKTNE